MDTYFYEIYTWKYVDNLKKDPNFTLIDIKKMSSGQHLYRYQEFYQHLNKDFRINTKYIENKWDLIYPIIIKKL